MGLSLFNFFTVAAGSASAGKESGGFSFMFIIIAMLVLMYFMMIRPQQKRQKQHRALVEALGVGDEVVTSGGIAGRVDKLGDTFVTVEIAEHVKIKLQRASIAKVMPKGTLKAA